MKCSMPVASTFTSSAGGPGLDPRQGHTEFSTDDII